MRNLRIVWGILVMSGLMLIALGYVFETALHIGEVPGLAAVGAALLLLAITSMLNWVFKAAWEQRKLFDSTSD